MFNVLYSSLHYGKNIVQSRVIILQQLNSPLSVEQRAVNAQRIDHFSGTLRAQNKKLRRQSGKTVARSCTSAAPRQKHSP